MISVTEKDDFSFGSGNVIKGIEFGKFLRKCCTLVNLTVSFLIVKEFLSIYLTFIILHDGVSQETEVFITTAMRISDRTYIIIAQKKLYIL